MRVSGKTRRAIVSIAIYMAFYGAIGLFFVVTFDAVIWMMTR